jgi:DNA-binding Xre family transcriptional regulator
MTTLMPSADEIARLLAERNTRAYSLREVAEMLGISERSLTLKCRAGKVEHIRDGRQRRMTLRQIELLTASLKTGTTVVDGSADLDNMQQALEMSRRSAARSTPRRAAA